MPINAINVIRNDIDAALGRTGALLGLDPGPNARNVDSPYPFRFGTSNDASAIDVSNWNESPFPYIFAVSNQQGINAEGFQSFMLPLNPQSITQTELFAHSIKPTQGGTVITHSGNRYKSLRISGTTGIAPFRGQSGVNKETGVPFFNPGGLKYKSGYEVFLLLRNYFKCFYEFKADGRLNSDDVLVFRNYKDGEYLAVELMSFNMKRDASRPFLYDYDLEFKVLRSIEFQALIEPTLSNFETRLNDAVNKVETARGLMMGFQGSLRQVESTFNSSIIDPLRLIGLTVKSFVGLGLSFGDIGSRIIRNTFTLGGIAATLGFLFTEKQTQSRVGGGTTTLAEANIPSDAENAAASLGADALIDLGPLLNEIDISQAPQEARDALDREVSELALPRQFYVDTIGELERVRNNLEDFVGLNSTTYDTIFGRTSTVTADTGRSITNDEFDLLNAFNLAVSGIQDIISTSILFQTSYEDEVETMVGQFSGNIDLETEPAVREITLRTDVTLEQVALEYLQDPTRWPEIAILNGLKAPYICQAPRFVSFRRSNTEIITDADLLTTDERAMFNFLDTAASPGDTILVPAPAIFGFGEAPSGAEISILAGLNQVEKNIGVDLKVDEETYDLILTPSGDLLPTAGADNMAQSIVLRLSYTPGDIVTSPTIGVNLNPGIKFPPLNEIRDDVIRSLVGDPRVDTIEDFTLSRVGGEIRLRFIVRIKQVDQPIPIELALPER